MSEEWLGSCEELSNKFNIDFYCCNSCHNDEDYGYHLLEVETNEGFYQVCCAGHAAYEKLYPNKSLIFYSKPPEPTEE